MSVWYDIDDKEDVDLSHDGKEVHILFNHDRTGNYYVSVPVKMLKKLLELTPDPD